MSVAQVLLIGSSRSPEVTYLLNGLRDIANFTLVATPSDALRRLRDATSLPDLIVAYEPRPGVWDSARSTDGTTSGSRPVLPETVFDGIYEVAPLVPRVTVCGAWCDGESRTGRIRRGEIRLEFVESLASLRNELPKLVDGSSLWRLPLTTSDEEFFQITVHPTGAIDVPKPPESNRYRVLVYEQDRGLRTFLEDVVRRVGMSPVGKNSIHLSPGDSLEKNDSMEGSDTNEGDDTNEKNGSDSTLLIGDLDDPEFRVWLEDRLRRNVTPLVPYRTLLLTTFARYDWGVQGLAAGMTILSKPFRTEDLLEFL